MHPQRHVVGLRALEQRPEAVVVERSAVEAALDPTESVAMRDSQGGPAPEAVNAQLSVAQDTLAVDREALATRRETVSSAENHRQTEVDRYV